MITNNCEQLSETWYSARCGIPTASNFDKIVTTKGAPSKQAEKYVYQLAGEQITGIKAETFSSPAMERGIEMEEEARQLYELVEGVAVGKVGLVYPDEQKKCACSPDGLMPAKGLEIKNPLMHTQVEYLLKGTLPTAYFQQVQGSMFITGFESWSFFSYYPGLPYLNLEIERNETFIKALEEELDKFCFELARVTKKLKEME